MEAVGISLSLTTNITNLASRLVKQHRDNKAQAKLLAKVQESAQQLSESLGQIADEDGAPDERYDELQELSDLLPLVRSELSNAKTRKAVDDVLKRLSKQAEKFKPRKSERQLLGPTLRSHPNTRPNTRPGTPAHSRNTSLKIPLINFSLSALDQPKPALISIHEPDGPVRADIILVHGLNSNARRTWTAGGYGNVFWPRDLLKHSFDDCATWVYSYDADVSQVLRSDVSLVDFLNASTRDLIKHVRNRILERRRSRTLRSRPLIWIAHSLGGIIVKNAIVMNDSLPEEEQFPSHTAGAIFFATPHAGSSFAARAFRFANIASLLAGDRLLEQQNQVSRINLHDSSLTAVTSAFTALLDKQPYLQVVSFFETDTMLTDRGPQIVVPSFLKLAHPNEAVDHLQGNHVTICKFEAKQERGYQRLTHFLEKFIGSQGLQHLQDPDFGRERSPTTAKTSASDAETTDINVIYQRLRLKIDRPTTRWTPAKLAKSNHGRWFVEGYNFSGWIDWIDQEGSPPILLQGPSGCGKTMIAESIMEGLRADSVKKGNAIETCHLHYYFNSTQAAQQSATLILLGFIAQTLDQNAGLARHLVIRSQDLRKDDRVGQALLSGTLRRMLEDLCWKKIYVIVDALDECLESFIKSTNDILCWMLEVPKIKLILTTSDDRKDPKSVREHGRWHPIPSLYATLERELLSRGVGFRTIKILDLYVWRRAIEEHIATMLALQDEEVLSHSEWSIVPRPKREMLRKALKEVPNITFTLIDVVLHHLLPEISRDLAATKEDDQDAIKTQIMHLSDLANVYSILIERVRRQDWPCVTVICMLGCTLEPLRILDLSTLLHYMNSIDWCDASLLGQRTSEIMPKISTPDMQQLISIDDEGLQLSNDLVRKAVLRQMAAIDARDSSEMTDDRSSEDFICQELMHYHLAHACLLLLINLAKRSKSKPRDPDEKYLVFPGEDYAKNNWQAHFREARGYDVALNDRLIEYYELYPNQTPLLTSPAEPRSLKLVRRMTEDGLPQGFEATIGNSKSHDIPELPNLDGFLEELDAPQGSNGTLNTSSSHTVHAADLPKAESSHARFQQERQLVDHINLTASEPSSFDSIYFDRQIRQFKPEQTQISYFLEIAIVAQNLVAIDSLLQTYHSQIKAGGGPDLLQMAVDFSKRPVIGRMLKHYDCFNLSASFIRAVEYAKVDICTDLLAYGADVDTMDSSKSYTIHLAVKSGQDNIVELLLSWNASVNVKDREGRTALHLAAECGHVSIARLLLQNSCHQTIMDEAGRTPLFTACASGKQEIVRTLWLAGAEIGQKDANGRIALHAAAKTGQPEVVRMLLTTGQSPAAWDNLCITPLQEAAENGWTDIVKTLLESGARVNDICCGGSTALHFACTSLRAPEDTVQLLLDKKGDPTLADALGRTPILIAAHYSTLRVLCRLLNLGLGLEHRRDNDGHGLEDYVRSRVHLTPYEKAKLSKHEQNKLEVTRRANQKDKIAFLGYKRRLKNDADLTVIDLRSLADSEKQHAIRSKREDADKVADSATQLLPWSTDHLL